jgi:hypothetical protein
MMESVMVFLVPFGGIMAMLSLCCVAEFVTEIFTGDMKFPKKKPRSVAAKRGVVGRKIRRTKYKYIEIIPDYSGSVNGLRVRNVWR